MIKKYFLSLIIIFTVLLTFIFAETSKSDQKRLITVSTTDYIETLPDTAYFNFEYSIEKDSPEEAGLLGEQLKKNVREVYSNNQILKNDILLDASSLSERYDYQNKKTVHIYTYNSKIRFLDFNKISPLRKALINEKTFSPVKEAWFSKRGLSVNQYTNYEIVQNKAELEKQALKKAYEKALLKIKGISEVSNFKYSIYRVTEGGTSFQPQPLYKARTMLAASETTEDASGDETIPTLQRINSSVTVEAEIL